MNLDSTTKVLRIVLGEAKTTNDCNIVASYADSGLSTFTLGNQNENSNGTTPVVVVSAPAIQFQRQVKEIRLNNNDTVAHTVTLQLFDGTSTWIVAPSGLTVPVGGSFVYTPESGVCCSTSTLIVEDQSAHVIGQVGTLIFEGVVISGTSPQAIANMTTITGTAGTGIGRGGAVNISGGASGTGATGNAGDLILNGGIPRSTNGDGGDVNIAATNATGSGNAGNVFISAGSSPSGTQGIIEVESQLLLTSGTPTVPAVNSDTIAGTDQAGIITIGPGATTSVVVTFGGTYSGTFFAVVLTPANAAAAAAGVGAYVSSISATGWTLNGTALANCSFCYHAF